MTTNERLIEERQRIGAAIKKRREELGMTHQDLADATGLKQPNITRIEKGMYSTGLDILTKVFDALGMKLEAVKK